MKILEKIKEFLNGSVLLNWDSLSKSNFVMILGALTYIIWIIWYLFVFSVPELKYWMDESLFTSHIIVSVIIIFLFLLWAFIGIKWKDNIWIQTYFPYFCIMFFGVTLIYGGFNVGIISPATIGSYISLISVGIVLFERKIIYSTAIPVTIFLLGSIVLSAMGKIPYAPLFSNELNSSTLSENPFWIYSMLYLYVPIFFISIVLFEILLTQWRNREKQIQIMSQLDPLTGIFNRRFISQSLGKIHQKNGDYSLVVLDLDFFKNINDSYGHDVGDRVLRDVAQVLSLSLRGNDLVGRFGGEEFVLLLSDKQQIHAMEIAERCREKIEQLNVEYAENQAIKITASFGVATWKPGLTREVVLRQADQALYLAKKNGRNQVRSYLEITA